MSGPETTMPVAEFPCEKSIPHSFCFPTFISAAFAASTKSPQSRLSSGSLLYEPKRIMCPLYCFNFLTRVSRSIMERPDSKYWVRAKSASISSARLATAPTFLLASSAARLAASDSAFASLASDFAPEDAVAASSASLDTIPKSCSFAALICVSTCSIWESIRNSFVIPPATIAIPVNPIRYSHVLGFSGTETACQNACHFQPCENQMAPVPIVASACNLLGFSDTLVNRCSYAAKGASDWNYA